MSSPSSSKKPPKAEYQPIIQPLTPQQSRPELAPASASSGIERSSLAILSSPLSPSKKRKMEVNTMAMPVMSPTADMGPTGPSSHDGPMAQLPSAMPAPKKSRTNTPWTPAEEKRLKTMRDAGSTWSEIAKTFPNRTEGSVKKHWYKDMHYADFAEDESAALLQAIKDYDANKWKVIGQKVGKPAKACEQYAKENFAGRY